MVHPMKRSKKSSLLVLGVVAGLLVTGIVYFRAEKTPSREEAEKPVVAGTIYPLYDIARNVAGENVEVKLILPSGASPHLFEFSPRQLKALQNVETVFAIGHGLDDWATQITNVVKGARVMLVDQGIKLRTFEDGTTDPHYWLHFGNARRITENIAKTLIEMDPAHAVAYRASAETYKEKLVEKEHELTDVLAPAQGQPILTFHDAWFYFAEDFGLKIAGTFEPSAGEEPTPRSLAALQQTIEKEQIRIMFIEPQLSSGVLESFAKDNNVSIAELDPLGGVKGRTTYLELMAFNADSVRRALQKQGP
jgi:ABC-type Zn uptake system ZnuABC Zn-binding protein ZnuA